jgi:uncharacterized cupin superfamily protein
MERTTVNDIDPWMSPASVKRSISHVLGAEHCALHYYELAPGETFGFGYHRHADQEELFYVLEGTATFETEDGEASVGAGEAIRFAPGEWQLGRNDSDRRVRALALGAPAVTGETEVRRDCPECGTEREVRVEPMEDRDALVAICETCGTELVRHS